MYARVVRIPKGDLLPVLTLYPFIGDTLLQKDLTGALNAKFWMKEYDTGTVLITGANATIAQLNPGIVVYPWAGSDTGTRGHYITWAKVYFGASNTIPLTIIGPEVFIVNDGDAVSV